MARRDQLTYDVEHRSRRSRPTALNPALLALLIGVLLAAALLVTWTVRSPESETGTPAAETSVDTPAASRSKTTATAGSSAPALQAGTDAGKEAHAPDGSADAAAAFVAAWLERSEDERASALALTAVPGLVEQLKLTSQDNIPDATPTGTPVLDSASAYSVTFIQALSNGDKIRVYLVADPEADHGWLATSVEPADEG